MIQYTEGLLALPGKFHGFVMSSSNIFELQMRAVTALKKAQEYLKAQVVKGENAESFGWTQFLEEKQRHPDLRPGITGTTCGLVALVACGENPASPLVRGARQTLKSFQRCDGGWSTSPLHEITSLTRPTCLAVNALTVAGESLNSPVLDKAALWLVNARNADGGYGNSKQDGRSEIVSTALATEALAQLKMKSLDGGLAGTADWIINYHRSTDGGHIRETESPSEVVHAAHVITALMASGRPRALLQERIEWLAKRIEAVLKGQLPDRELQIHDDIVYSGPDGSWRQKFYWTHLPRQRALLALLDSGVDLAQNKFLLSLLEGLIKDQKPEGFWQTEIRPEQVPVWLFTENCRVLRRFVDRVIEQHDYLVLKQELHQIDKRLSKLESGSNIKRTNNPFRYLFERGRLFWRHIDLCWRTLNEKPVLRRLTYVFLVFIWFLVITTSLFFLTSSLITAFGVSTPLTVLLIAIIQLCRQL